MSFSIVVFRCSEQLSVTQKIDQTTLCVPLTQAEFHLLSATPREVVDMIATLNGSLLEIVNYNIEVYGISFPICIILSYP